MPLLPSAIFLQPKPSDFIRKAIDDSGIIILRELQPSEDYSDLDDIAHMLVDMLNTEAMTSAWVSYSNIADDLKQLPDALRGPHCAWKWARIFTLARMFSDTTAWESVA